MVDGNRDQGRIAVSEKDFILTVALSRPEKRNAFDAEMIAQLTAVFTTIPVHTRAIRLIGHGESFCAGADLAWMKSSVARSIAENLTDAETLFDLYAAVRSAAVPVVARVHGHAFGGGAGLLSACDIVAAESKTQLSFSEVKWGLVPAVISPFVLDKVLPALAREWFLTGKVFLAEEAMRGGLINFVGELAEVDQFIDSTLKATLTAGPEAVRTTKAMIAALSLTDWAAARDSVPKIIARVRTGAEGQAGLAAFLGKKSPPWKVCDAQS